MWITWWIMLRLSISLKNMNPDWQLSNKNSKIEIRITFENKIGYLALLTSETSLTSEALKPG